MFKKLLIANRGEIALRVMRTCRDLGIATVAVYSDVDRAALHVRLADEAYLLGHGTPGESYLNIERIIDAGRRSGAEAVHPGYGFLSENAALVDACEAAGLAFVGPAAQAMRTCGDKVSARRLATECGVPVVPGEDRALNAEEALAAADRLGYPVLVKAVSGGGGKGIRVVNSHDEMEAALRIAGSEAASAFGDRSLYVEKHLDRVRHIEVQFIADSGGEVVTLGERECSIQRRHQKLIEESPSSAVDAALREKLCDAAVRLAKAAGYVNAGTTEFLLDASGNYYFLEINARLQVEHPVTEMVTGIDLVAEQLRVAAGEPLSFKQADIEPRGWAIECRITAEDPFNNFLPSLGRVDYVRQPSGPGVRVDSALFDGADLPYYYDPMIAKVIAWGRTRDEALRRIRRALGEFTIVGVDTNIPFHLQLLNDPRFVDGHIYTAFLDNEFTIEKPGMAEGEKIALLVAGILNHQRRNRSLAALAGQEGAAWRASRRSAAIRDDFKKGRSWRSTV